jgi:hypothetical protein
LTWFVVKCKVESQQVERPPGLMSIDFLGNSKVLKVFVISPDLYGMASTFEVMSLPFQSSDYGKHLSVMDLVILLNQV